MTVKMAHTLNYWWDKLYQCVREYQRDVTAGELARYAGVSRNTAQKYLKHLKKHGTATETRVRHNRAQKKSVFCTIGEM